MRGEPPGACGDLLGIKGQRAGWGGALGQEGLQQGKRPPVQAGEGVKRGIWRGSGHLRDTEQVWLALEQVGHRRVGSGWWPGGGCG